jgi:hypothetical protein
MLYNYTALQDFCEKNKIVLNLDYSNEMVNIFFIIEGMCLGENCTSHFSKSFRSLVKTNGYCLTCAKQIGRVKVEKTCLEKFGNTNPLKSDAIKEKIKQTNLVKYGVEHVSQNSDIQEKIKKTNLERYGVERPAKSQLIKNKIKETSLLDLIIEEFTNTMEINIELENENLERLNIYL